MEIEESIENKNNILEHELLQQVYDRIVGNTEKESFPPIIPQLYYAINDLKISSTTEVNSNNADIDVDMETNNRKKSEVDNIIPIVTYDEEETGAENIHTGTKNLESLTAPIRYRIKVSKKIFEDEMKKKQESIGKEDADEDKLYLNDLLKTDITSWALKISEMEEELKEKEDKLQVVRNKIKGILE
ncbi:hypothetical protein D499_0BA00100 [Hanseniaspora uvarum DSM 2768]|nr:hypothetical protein D499_0BA00100 [Hanseniaspora uvarum DSM 2768]